MKRIGLIYALGTEAALLIEDLKLRTLPPADPDLPFLVYSGTYHGLELRLIVAGTDPRDGAENIGTNAAVLATYEMIRTFQPELILNPGTAGAFQTKGARIGEVFIGRDVVRFHDRRVSIPRFENSSVGHYPVQPARRLAEALNLRMGIVSSGNSLDCPEIDLERILANEADLKEMEAAAIGWVAWMKRVPFLPIKSVTDFIEHHETVAEQFYRNYELACRELTRVVKDVLRYASERTLDQF